MTTYRQQPDGTWVAAAPLPWSPGYDVEVGQYGRWELYAADRLVAKGTNSWLGRVLAIRRAIRRDRKATP